MKEERLMKDEQLDRLINGWSNELVLQLMQWMPKKYEGIFNDPNIFDEIKAWSRDSLRDLSEKIKDKS